MAVQIITTLLLLFTIAVGGTAAAVAADPPRASVPRPAQQVSRLLFPGDARVPVGKNSEACFIVSRSKSKPLALHPDRLRVSLECAAGSQVLWESVRHTSWEYPHFEVLSAGDWDSDGRIDLLLDLIPNLSEQAGESTLFLSKGARIELGRMVERVGEGVRARAYVAAATEDRTDPRVIKASAFYERTRACIEKGDRPCLAAVFPSDAAENGILNPSSQIRAEILSCFTPAFRALNVRALIEGEPMSPDVAFSSKCDFRASGNSWTFYSMQAPEI